MKWVEFFRAFPKKPISRSNLKPHDHRRDRFRAFVSHFGMPPLAISTCRAAERLSADFTDSAEPIIHITAGHMFG